MTGTIQLDGQLFLAQLNRAMIREPHWPHDLQLNSAHLISLVTETKERGRDGNLPWYLHGWCGKWSRLDNLQHPPELYAGY